MKGLLKNNYYIVCANERVFSVFMLVTGAFVISVISPPLLFGYMYLGMVGFSGNALAGTGNGFTSKWGRYQLTMPVTRADIIKSYYMSQVL